MIVATLQFTFATHSLMNNFPLMVLVGLSLYSSFARSQEEINAAQVVQAVEGVFGVNPGQR
jgi:hypothetical protein